MSARSVRSAVRQHRELMENGADKVVVNTKNLDKFLGKSTYSYLMANKKDEVGIARGLAWTQVGGDTLADRGKCHAWQG